MFALSKPFTQREACIHTHRMPRLGTGTQTTGPRQHTRQHEHQPTPLQAHPSTPCINQKSKSRTRHSLARSHWPTQGGYRATTAPTVSNYQIAPGEDPSAQAGVTHHQQTLTLQAPGLAAKHTQLTFPSTAPANKLQYSTDISNKGLGGVPISPVASPSPVPQVGVANPGVRRCHRHRGLPTGLSR